MLMNPAGIALIKHFEGFSPNPYVDSNSTHKIGYGCPCPPGVHSINAEAADGLLKVCLAHFEAEVTRLVTTEINDNQFSALVSFAFNLGGAALARSTLLEKLNSGLPRVEDEFLRWAYINGYPSTSLLKRRQAERELFITPLFVDN